MTDLLNMVIGLIVVSLALASFIAYPGLQYSALRQLRGAWRVLSAVPLAVMAVVLVFTAVALFEGANLWPLLLVFTAPLATLYLLLLRLAMHLRARRG